MTVDLMSANVNTIERIMMRSFKIEYCTVVAYDKFGDCGVQIRDDPNGEFWNTCTVKVKAVKNDRVSGSGVSDNPIETLHYYCNVLQGYNQKWAGRPWTPRIGDLVAVLFIYNQMPLILGTVYSLAQDPVCRAPFDIKKYNAIDARYDDVNKWCQWEDPIWNDQLEVVEHFPGKHPICDKTFHRNRDQIYVTDCLEGNKSACKCCTYLDHVKRTGNQWEKIYSCDTDSKDCCHPYIPGCVEKAKRRHEWHEPSGSYFVFQNNPCGDLDFGKGLVRLGNATCECNQKAHINLDPRGTVDIHTKNEKATPYAAENEGTRMSVVSLDDATVDHSFEAIDFNVNSWIEILKTGTILLNSLDYASYIRLLGTNNQVEIYGTNYITEVAAISIQNQSPLIVEDCSTHQITGFCSHGGCSCSSSDKRLKTNIESLEYGLNEINQLNPISFKFKSASDDVTHLGFIAQDVQTVIPEVVQEQPDNMLGIRYDELIPILVNAIKELKDRIEFLETELKERNNLND